MAPWQHRWWRHSAVIVGAVTAFMAIAAWQALPWWEYAFRSDDSPVSWLSASLLMANAAVALNLTLTRSLPSLLGGVITGSLALMALDEQFLLHERFKESVPPAIGEAPMVLIGVGGTFAIARLWRTVPSQAARRLFLSAIAAGLFALWVDLGQPPVVLARLEEAVEVLAESLFLCGLYEVSHSTCSRVPD